MKPSTSKRKSNGYQSDDDNIRYKFNTEFINNTTKLAVKPTKEGKKPEKPNQDDNILYKFPQATVKIRPLELKQKSKPKIKVNFWSNKQSSRLNKGKEPEPTNRRHTVTVAEQDSVTSKPKHSAVKVRKRVSFLPTPLFSDNHVPMVTVPDDLTINLNAEEAHELRDDLNAAFINSMKNKKSDALKHKSKSIVTQTSPTVQKRRHSPDYPRLHNNENELEFFTKYVVQKLRRMETNQRIYSENLINTVLMLGQLGKLNGKSKINDA